MGDAIFDAYYASNVQNVADALAQEKSMAAAGVALLERIGPAVVVTHSQAGLYGWKWADERPQLVMALVQIEPKGPPFEEAIFSNDFSRAYGLTSVPLTFSPVLTEGTNASLPLPYEKVAPPDGSGLLPCLVQREPARKLPQLAKVPMVVVSSEASYHAQYDYCFIKFLKQAGVMADHLELGKEGIHGNAHLMFMEKNSDEVAGAVHKWISKTIGVR
jgi:pimeloyl-ACP methyl ester carboxylesterase